LIFFYLVKLHVGRAPARGLQSISQVVRVKRDVCKVRKLGSWPKLFFNRFPAGGPVVIGTGAHRSGSHDEHRGGAETSEAQRGPLPEVAQWLSAFEVRFFEKQPAKILSAYRNKMNDPRQDKSQNLSARGSATSAKTDDRGCVASTSSYSYYEVRV
jgi:hypothetical protein